MKRNYSYFIIKPDGIRFFDKIHQKFKDNFQEIRYFRIEDFERVIKKLYFRHYENKGNKFANSFEQYLYASKSIFGNEALLAIVADQSKEELLRFKTITGYQVNDKEHKPNISSFVVKDIMEQLK